MAKITTLDESGFTVGANSNFGASPAREFAEWYTSYGSGDYDTIPDLPELRSRARDLDRNDSVSKGALRTILDNVVGPGFRLASRPDWRALEWTAEEADQWARTEVEPQFRTWWETTECDASGKKNGHSLTRQAYNSVMLNGEALALPVWLPRPGELWSTKLLMLESDRLCNPYSVQDTVNLRGGIEIDDFGRPLAYHIRNPHPGDRYLSVMAEPEEWRRIPAEFAFGRKRVLHVHEAERPEQNRATPALTAAIADLRMRDRYKRTEMQAAVVNSMVAAFVETALPSEALTEIFGGDTSSHGYQQYLQMRKEYSAKLKGAAIINLPPGSQLSSFDPSRPGDQFEPFMEATLRDIGLSVGLPLELIQKNFSKTNYSSARAALAESWRYFMTERAWFNAAWTQQCYLLWFEEAVNAGRITAPDFYLQRYAYTRSSWIGAGKGVIDPVKEAQGSTLRLQNNTTTLARENAEQAQDWEETLEQQAREEKRKREIWASQGLGEAPKAAPVEPQQTEDREEEIPA